MRSGMIEELPVADARLPLHPRARAARAVRPAVSAVRRAELHLRDRRGARGDRQAGAAARMLADLAHHFAAAAPIDGPRARDRLQPARRRRRDPPRSPTARRRRACARRCGSASTTSTGAPRSCSRSASTRYREGRTDEALEAFAPGGGDRAATRRRRAARARGDRVREDLLAARPRPTRARASCSTRRRRRSTPRTRRCASACSPASPARSSSRATTTQRASVRERRRSRWRAASTTGRGARDRADGLLLGALDDRAWTTILEMLDRGARPRRASSATSRSRPRRWSGGSAALMALGEIPAARAELAVAHAHGAGHAAAVHPPRRRALPLRDRAARGPAGRGRGDRRRARASGAGCSLGRDASGIYGVQMFGVRREQGRLAELAPVVRVLAGGRARRRRVAARASRRCSPSSAWPTQAARELDRVRARRACRSCARRCGSASLTYLADAASAVGAHGRSPSSSTRSSSRSPGTNVMIGHGVACYGSADRYLGMLAATLGERELAARALRGGARASTARMGARTWLAHTAYEFGRLLLAATGDGRSRAAQLLAEAARSRRRSGCPCCSRRIRALGGRSAQPAAAGRALRPRGRRPAARRRGLLQPRDRQRALHQRAHRREPRPQHPAQDRLREPHRGRRLRVSPRTGRALSEA